LGFVLGGWLNAHYGWRLAFALSGLPALALAVLVKLTVVEPRLMSRAQLETRKSPPMVAVLSALWHQRSTRHLGIGIVLLWTLGGGMAPWYAAFMMRSHGMRTAELGVWLGLIFGCSGVVGTLAGGYVATRWFAQDERAQMRLSGLMVALLMPFYILFLLLPSRGQVLAVLVPLVIVNSVFIGPAYALMQRLVVDEIRSTTLSVIMLFANLIGLGVGPQVVGILSDLLAPSMGTNSLRYAMLIMSFVALWSGYHFWQVGNTVKGDLAALARRTLSETTLERFDEDTKALVASK
jgi:predicted MFS family arabinose efflux permease